MPSVLKTLDLLCWNHDIPAEVMRLIVRFLWQNRIHDINRELTAPRLHKAIERCMGNGPSGLLDINRGRLMIRLIFPQSFSNHPRLISKSGPVSRFKPYKSLSIGPLDFTTWGESPENTVRWPSFQRPETSMGLYIPKIPLDRRYSWVDSATTEDRIIDAINTVTGAWVEEESGTGRQIEGLYDMSLQELYHTFMKLPEFDED